MTDILNNYEIGQRVRNIRLKANCTQNIFAEDLDISITFLSGIENGKKGISKETLAKLCTAYNVSADYILFGKEQKKQNLIDMANSMNEKELRQTITYFQSLLEMRKMMK